MIKFSIAIKPEPKGRPRFWNGRTVTPTKTRKFESAFASLAARYCPANPITGPIAVKLIFKLKAPKKLTRFAPSVRPDIDNLVKAVLDSMSRFWNDDAQIVSLQAEKVYGAPESVEVCVQEWLRENESEGV